MNESYEAITVTPDGSNIDVNLNMEKFFEAYENGTDIDVVVAKAVDTIEGGLNSQYENNAVIPSVDKLKEIAKHLETTVVYLVDGIETIISAENKEILEALHNISNEVIRNSLIEHIKQLALV